MARYLIVISRARPDLLAPLAIAYGQRGQAEIVFDRRQGQRWLGLGVRPNRRTRPHLNRTLQTHGFLVIALPTSACAPHRRDARTATHVRRTARHAGWARNDAASVRHA